MPSAFAAHAEKPPPGQSLFSSAAGSSPTSLLCAAAFASRPAAEEMMALVTETRSGHVRSVEDLQAELVRLPARVEALGHAAGRQGRRPVHDRQRPPEVEQQVCRGGTVVR